MKVLLVVLLFAITAEAQTTLERTAHIAMWGAQGADTFTTIHALSLSDQIREGNKAVTIFGNNPKAIAGVMLGFTFAGDRLAHYKLKGHPTNKAVVYLIAASEHSLFAVLNMRLASQIKRDGY